MHGVQRMDSRQTGRSAAPRPAANPPPHAPGLRAPSPELLSHLNAENAALTARVAVLERLCATLESQVAAAGAGAKESEARLAVAAADAAAATAELAARRARQDEMHRRVVELEAEARDLRARNELVGAAPDLRSLLERRGLRGEAEHAAALRALLDARREGALYTGLVAPRGDALAEFLAERLVLLGEGEPVPEGRVVVRVPAARSEGKEEGAIREACSRFSTACLVAGLKRIVFVGGSPAYRRQLKEGLDRRLDVRVVEGDRHRPPRVDADLVIVWAATELDHTVSAQFPGAMTIPHRGIARMLTTAAERING